MNSITRRKKKNQKRFGLQSMASSVWGNRYHTKKKSLISTHLFLFNTHNQHTKTIVFHNWVLKKELNEI